MKKILLTLCFFGMIALPAMAQVSIHIDLEMEDFTFVMNNLPDGSGSTFDNCWSGNQGSSSLIDNTMKITVTDSHTGAPITQLIPEYSHYIEFHASEQQPYDYFYMCDGNSPSISRVWIYDFLENYSSPTGEYYIKGDISLPSGGFSTHAYTMQVVIFDNLLPHASQPCWVTMRSADINHDGIVDMADVGIFSQAFFGPGDPPEGDLNGDGAVNLADVGHIQSGMNNSCY